MSSARDVVSSVWSMDGWVQFFRDEYNALLVGLIVVWGFLDTVSTFVAMEIIGAHQEKNPFVREILLTDPTHIIPYKAVALIAVAFLAVAGRNKIKTVPHWDIWFRTTIWLGLLVVFTNFGAVVVELY